VQNIFGIFEKLSVHIAGNEDPPLFTAGGGESDEEEEKHPTSVTL